MAHEKIFGVCENKCFVETLSKDSIEQSLEGKSPTTHNHDDRYYTKTSTDIAIAQATGQATVDILNRMKVLSTTVTVSSGVGVSNIGYPQGFTKANCVVMSAMANNVYGQVGDATSEMTTLAALKPKVTLTDSNVNIMIRSTSDGAVPCKIVLYKYQ